VRRPLIAGTSVAVVTGMAAPAAPAALHNINDFSHGIVSTPGWNCGVSYGYCRAWIHDVDGTELNANLTAGMYHREDNGSFHRQPNGPSSCVNCTSTKHDAYNGTTPCRKYAGTSGNDPTSYLNFHRMNAASCQPTIHTAGDDGYKP
jgi:hypothetical protein